LSERIFFIGIIYVSIFFLATKTRAAIVGQMATKADLINNGMNWLVSVFNDVCTFICCAHAVIQESLPIEPPRVMK
jgi:hypothetical protein